MTSTLSRVLCLGLALALTGCTGGGNKPAEQKAPVDIESANSIAAAEAAYARGALAEAAVLFQRALTRARAMDDPNLISQNAYNIAACYIALGRYEATGDLLNEALDETIRVGGNTADVLLMMAKVEWLRGQPDESLDLCDRALSSPGARPSDAHRIQVYLLRGQMDCGRENIAAANAELAHARKLAGPSPSAARAAGLENLAGLIDQHSGRFALAATAFDREANNYRSARLYRDMARALGRAGGAYEAANQFNPAGERYYRAARAILAQGDRTLARRFLESALADATKAADQQTLARVRAIKIDGNTPVVPSVAP